MKIKWYGHSSFGITTEEGINIITDPYESGSYDGAVGYAPITDTADIVTVSHDHADHNAVHTIKGKPDIVKGSGKHTVKNIEFEGLVTYHDDEKGKGRGENIIYIFTVDGIKLAHLGDLGHIPDEETMRALRDVDVIFIPIGGYFTISAAVAHDIVEKIMPSLVVPMHYKTEVLDFPLTPISEFTKQVMYNIREVGGDTFELTMDNLPDETEVLILNYVR